MHHPGDRKVCTLQAYKALEGFRAQIGMIRLQAAICESDEVIDLLTSAIDLENYIKGGAYAKQGDPKERWARVCILKVSRQITSWLKLQSPFICHLLQSGNRQYSVHCMQLHHATSEWLLLQVMHSDSFCSRLHAMLVECSSMLHFDLTSLHVWFCIATVECDHSSA